MKNKRMLFPIALVVAIIISASSMAMAATSPIDELGITLPTDESEGVALTAAFSATQTSWTAPYNVSFTDKSTGSVFVWIWDFGDGSEGSNDQSPIHAYAAAGKYNVTLQVMGAGGSNAITKVITIAASKPSTTKAPVAAFTTSISGKTVKFTDKSTGSPTSLSWNFGDKSTSTAKSPSHKYAKAGKYKVTLTAKNKNGSNTKTGYVTVK